jgi:hypothetical protein
MKRFITFTFISLLFLSCSRENDIKDVQREESFGEDDFRDSDNYRRTVPLEPDKKPAP